ncbi:hypothetical protein X759_36250 [Mesorhizobium sp. LSHC420B00]|nr:hypothetical protein X759_36250 [Mesorhizobium sp. LSHC420B00]
MFERADFFLFFAAMVIVSQYGGSHANFIRTEIGSEPLP